MKKENGAKLSFCSVLAAGEGFEPSQTESESVVLPLHNPAISFVSAALLSRKDECYYSKQSGKVKGKFKKIGKKF